MWPLEAIFAVCLCVVCLALIVVVWALIVRVVPGRQSGEDIADKIIGALAKIKLDVAPTSVVVSETTKPEQVAEQPAAPAELRRTRIVT